MVSVSRTAQNSDVGWAPPTKLSPTHPMPPPPTQLQYAPARPRRKWRRWILLALSITAIALTTRWAKPIYQQTRYLYWQRQCMHYTLPADQVVIETDHIKAAKLLDKGDEYIALEETAFIYPTQTIGWIGGRSIPKEIDHILNSKWDIDTTTTSILFLHGRQTSEGRAYLIALRCSLQDWQGGTHRFISIVADVVRPAALRIGSRTTAQSHDRSTFTTEVQGALTIYAGQADPNDNSHLTLKYILNGAEGTIDGWLRSDDTVRLTVRNGPLQLK